MGSQAPHFTRWLDSFFESYYRNRPVNATFIGIHTYDDRLPDFSENGSGDTLAEMEALLAELDSLPEEKLTATEKIDRQLAEGFLNIQCWEYRSNHFQRGNPSTYTGEAIFGLISLFLTCFAPLEKRLESALKRLEDMPAFLRQAELNLRQAPAAWTARAMRECQGAQELLETGIDQFMAVEGIDNPQVKAAATKAVQSFNEFHRYLERELLAHPTQEYACGPEAFELMLHDGHCIDQSAEALAIYAQDQLEEAHSALVKQASEFEAATPEQALDQLNGLHPSIQGYYARYGELWEACKAASQAHEFLTWPDFPIRYQPQPVWARKAAPYLYFLFYRSPAAFNRPAVHDYLVTPIQADMPLEEQQKLLQANNDSVIKLNHVVHHGSIGHHVQNWHAYQAESRIGQIAAVDCASRIAMFCGGTMAEGWAVYATDLMAETGFLTPLEIYSELQTRRRMCARAIVDVRLHQGRLSLEQAARFYEQRAGMSPGAAHNEAVKNSMFPGAAVMYILGSDRIHRLRRELASRSGRRFNLRAFHDRLLSFGSAPVELVAREMEANWNGPESQL